MHWKHTFSKINNTLAKIEGAVMVFWFAIVLVVMTCQVVSRYIFNAPIAWSEEFARYSFVWISYIGCAYCVSVDAHTGITAFRDALPPKAKKLTTVLARNTFHWVLAFADAGLSTPAVFAELDRLRDVGTPPRLPERRRRRRPPRAGRTSIPAVR